MSDFKIAELVEAAYLEGYRVGMEAYAWWKDGEQLLGNGRIRLADAMKNAPDDAREHYKRFLEKQRERFNEARAGTVDDKPAEG
jgi:hypothetical protein